MPQFKRVDEQGRPVFNRVDEAGKPVAVSAAPALPKPRPAPLRGVDDPTRDMDPRQHQNALWSEVPATLLEPFSARGGHGEWKIPDAITGMANTAYGLLFGGPAGQLEALGGIAHGVVDPFAQAVSSDPRERVQGGVRILRDSLPALWGMGRAAPAATRNAASLLPEAIRLKELANTAADYRQSPSAQPLPAAARADMPRSVNLARQVTRAGKRVVAATAEGALNTAAKVKNWSDSAPSGTGLSGALPERTGAVPLEGELLPESLPRSTEGTIRESVRPQPGVRIPSDDIGAPATQTPRYDPFAPTGNRSGMTPGELETGVPVREIVPQTAPFKPPTTKPEFISYFRERLRPTKEWAKVGNIRNAERLAEIAPELLEIPVNTLDDLKVFDDALVRKFSEMEQGVGAQQAAMPPTTRVPKTAIIDNWNELVDEYKRDGRLPQAATIQKLIDTWKQLPDQIPWEQFVPLKRAMGVDMARSVPLSRAYQALMDQEVLLSEGLSKANHGYSVVRRAMSQGGIVPIRDTASGQIISHTRIGQRAGKLK